MMMECIPLRAMLSNMVLASASFKCTEEIIVIVAMLCVANSVSVRPDGKEEKANISMQQFQLSRFGINIGPSRLATRLT